MKKSILFGAGIALTLAIGAAQPASASWEWDSKPVNPAVVDWQIAAPTDPLEMVPPAFGPNGVPTPKHDKPKKDSKGRWISLGKDAPNRELKGVEAMPPTPSKVGLQAKAAKTPSAVYRYAGMKENAVTQGAYANFFCGSPFLDTQDHHSLFEIAAIQDSGVAGGRDIVEVGCNVSRTVNGGSDNTHLFVYRWKNDATSCYNGCGFVDYGPNALNAGANIEALGHVSTNGTVSKRYGIQYNNPGGLAGQGAWWVWYDTDWVGYFPESIWYGTAPSQTFAATDQVQIFGEVVVNEDTAVTTDVKCTDMGTGKFASHQQSALPYASRLASAQYFYSSGATTPLPNMTAWNTDSSKWSVLMPSGTTRSIYVGGPGGLGNTGSC